MGTMAVMSALVILTCRRVGAVILILAGLFVLAVGLSLAFTWVHFPSDIMAGWSASLAWVTVFTKLYLANFYNPG